MPANIRVLVDTNVFVSSLLRPGPSRTIVEDWLSGRFQLIISQEILDELIATLRKRKIATKVFELDSALLVDAIKRKATFINPTRMIRICRDKSDDPVLSCAVEAGVESLITGDEDLLVLSSVEGITILTPSQFLA